ncbi:MAG: hypothetical protein HQ488_02135 [Parcubacteria group bacterium]|nr:hypothetical protein [Parcubacteria group bacterium]
MGHWFDNSKQRAHWTREQWNDDHISGAEHRLAESKKWLHTAWQQRNLPNVEAAEKQVADAKADLKKHQGRKRELERELSEAQTQAGRRARKDRLRPIILELIQESEDDPTG